MNEQRLRKGRVSIPGQIYLVTICCHHRYPFFNHYPLARWACRGLHDAGSRSGNMNLCYVTMPDHVHWLFQLGNQATLSATVSHFKGHTSRLCGVRLWQKGFHDHALRDEKDLKNIARYVVANPLRANLVESLRQYPYWDAKWL